MVSILVLLIIFALGYGAYRIIGNGFRFPQSEKLSGFGIFGFFVLIVLGVWLATMVFNRFFSMAHDRIGLVIARRDSDEAIQLRRLWIASLRSQ